MKFASFKVLCVLCAVVLVLNCYINIGYLTLLSNKDIAGTKRSFPGNEDQGPTSPLLMTLSSSMVSESRSISNDKGSKNDAKFANRGASNNKRSENATKFGYVMGTSYYDQLTGSFANMLSLQCWARVVGEDMRVVEPSLLESVLNINLRGIVHDNDSSAMFNDFFNRSQWNQMSIHRNAAPLISWDYFIENAPRKLILVDKPVQPLTRIFFENGALLEKKYGFEIVRKVNFPTKVLTQNKFMELVYDEYQPHEAVVIFRAWGGIASGDLHNRVGVSGTKCGRGVSSFTPVSSKIIQDGVRYVDKYIRNGTTKGYISVMIRMEHFLLKRHFFKGKTDAEIHASTMECLNNLLSEVNALKLKHGVDSVFLTMDCRDSGSYMFKIAYPEHISKIASDAMTTLFPLLYGNTTSLKEWDKSFDDTASFPGITGYVALLQKHIAARGVCLLTVGGGSFQSTALQLHTTYNRGGPKCSHQVKSC